MTQEQQEGISPSNDDAVSAELAKPEDISAYAEERAEQEAEDHPQDSEDSEIAQLTKEIREKAGLGDKKKTSRYERLKRARDQYKAEADELRQRLGKEPEPQQPENPYQAAREEGQQEYQEQHDQAEREAEFAKQLEHRDRRVAIETAYSMRAQEFSQNFPDFAETIQEAKDYGFNMPPQLGQFLLEHPLGPIMAYAICKDAINFGDEGRQGYLDHFEDIAHDPVAMAREMGKMEQALMTGMQRGQQRAKVTKAPPPMRPISGHASAPRDLHLLAAKDSAEDYIKARRGRE